MLRAYQSPASTADCGPQCAQIPNFASRNHSGIWYVRSDARVPSKGPLLMDERSVVPLFVFKDNAECKGSVGIPKAKFRISRLLERDIIVFGLIVGYRCCINLLCLHQLKLIRCELTLTFSKPHIVLILKLAQTRCF